MKTENKKTDKLEDSDLSKNHHKKVKYRIRKQEEAEAEKEIKEYEQGRLKDTLS